MSKIYTMRRRVIRHVGLRNTAPPEPDPDYDALLKVDVVEIARERGVDTSGTKADIVARLRS